MFNKKRIFVFLVSILLISLFILTSCKRTYIVSFYVDDAIYKEVEVNKNKTVEEIIAPLKDNYEFSGWYLNETKYIFSSKVKSDLKLVAKYVSVCDKNGHIYNDSCDSICNKCNEERNVEHSWLEATYTKPKTCSICGITEGEVKPRPTEIIVESSKVVLYINDTYQFNPSVLPNAVSQKVKYSIKTADGGEATITDEGLLTALHEGYVYVNISSDELSYIGTTVTVQILHPLITDGEFDAYNIMTGYGTDASSEVEINYHTHNIYTKVEYTLATDPDFTQFTDVTGTGYYFTHGIDNVDIPFPGRNVYRVSLKGLLPDTEYIYRINKGNDTYTETYSFKTAKNDGSDSAFIVMADIHYHAKTEEDGTFESHGSEISETVIDNILKYNSNANFIVTAGDIVDTGGNANTWSVFFEHSKSLKTMARMGVAGNHEYYISGTGQSDGRYQKAHYATVNNGPQNQLGLSSYVVYNDILLIMIDNEDASGRSYMLEWLDDILENVEYRYSIAFMHSPIYHENSDRDEKMMDVFDKHCVDLVVAGHYHGHGVVKNYYDGKVTSDTGLGVNYMMASFGGEKSRTEKNLAKGYLVETSNGVITMKYFDENGNLLETQTYVSKRNKEVVTETKDNLIQSVKGTYNNETNEYEISVSDKFYGNVKKMEIEELLRGEIKDDMVFPTASYNKYIIKDLKKNYQYNFKITLYFSDGTSDVIYESLDLATDINLQVTNVTNNSVTLGFNASDSSMLYIIKDYIVYINGVEYSTFNYLDLSDEPVLSYILTGLNSNTHYDIKLVARDYKGKELYEYSVETTTK